MKLHSNHLALSLAFLTIACGSIEESPLPLVDIPAKLQPTAETLKAVVPAIGVQIYECRVTQAGAHEWAFVAPEANLFDERGNKIGTHYAGPHWESSDGSKLQGTVKERADAPVADAIPWLWLTVKSVGKDGAFSRTTSIVRVRTVGGVAPQSGCSAASVGTTSRVNYTADYYFYAAN
jgi:hypothetical protein